ncbi:barstar family protein [Aeromicrobium sp. UC242_57]|uniref:barstar family protein n=1 Tax=Aeromicrobium sp. UC242_57 TaxID=3374624 RepID=UPI0037B3EA6B
MTTSYEALLAGTVGQGLFSWRGRSDRDLASEAEAAGWQALSIDTRGIGSIPDFYSGIAAAWGLPDWFGCNLDALFDVLVDLAAAPTVVIWDGMRDLVELDPIRTAAIVDVLRDAVEKTACCR